MKKIILSIGLTMAIYANTQSIVLGAGCFWGVEKYFSSLDGVSDVVSGYAGGLEPNPTYEYVVKNRQNKTNHAEVVQITYDDTIISTTELLKEFWELHDPTQGNAQGNDIGTNYRSAIYYTTNEQKDISNQTKQEYQNLLKKAGYGKITTEIQKLDKFYKAKEYHQNYLAKNPNGYCPNHATGVKFETAPIKTLKPLGGKEIVVIDTVGCGWCERFRTDVMDEYRGSIPMRSATEQEIQGYDGVGEVIGTPTVLFVVDGKVVYRHQGYMDERSFYRVMGELKLGADSEAFDVAFAKSTDRAFCKKYKIFQNSGDGVFVDKISGEVLFDTRDRFDSGSGWLSFYRAVDGAVIEKSDHSHGMKRIEIIAKKSGAHLGHVFDDAPNGRRRYCINATVLEFKARKDIPKI